MGKGRRGKRDGAEDQEKETPHVNGGGGAADPATARCAVDENAIAVAAGVELRVLDRRSGELHVLLPASREGATCVRGVAFDSAGRWLLAGGDDKAFRLWRRDGWELVATFKAPKKISAVAFTRDGGWALAADKFGDVLAARAAPRAPDAPEPGCAVLLGHWCSLLSSLAVSADGASVATADRDGRVRVSTLPADPAAGAPEIRAFCFGHTSFVSACAFVGAAGAEALLSGGGDGSVRLWDPATGEERAALQLGGGGAGAPARAVLEVAAAPCGARAAAVVDGRDEVALLAVDAAGGALRLEGWRALPGLRLTSWAGFDAGGRLWAAGGPLTEASPAAYLACCTVGAGGALEPDADALPAAQRAALEARAGGEEEEAAPRRSFVPGYLDMATRSVEEREALRKRSRVAQRAGAPDAGEGAAAEEAAVAEEPEPALA